MEKIRIKLREKPTEETSQARSDSERPSERKEKREGKVQRAKKGRTAQYAQAGPTKERKEVPRKAYPLEVVTESCRCRLPNIRVENLRNLTRVL